MLHVVHHAILAGFSFRGTGAASNGSEATLGYEGAAAARGCDEARCDLVPGAIGCVTDGKGAMGSVGSAETACASVSCRGHEEGKDESENSEWRHGNQLRMWGLDGVVRLTRTGFVSYSVFVCF